jgi:hypothetical protein
MKSLILLILLSYPLLVSAQKPHVIAVDPTDDLSALTPSFKVDNQVPFESHLPSREERDAYLKEIPETQSWDELQKDIFYEDLKSKSFEALLQKYPSINSSDLRSLHNRKHP